MVDSLTGNALASFPEVFGAAQAAALAVNNTGGVNGHTIHIVTCNDQFTPNGATACARQAVSDHVVAYAGFDLLSSAIYPVLQNAGIASTLLAVAPIDAQTPGQFPITGGGVTEFYGHAYAAAKAGAKTAAIVIPEIPGYQTDISNEELTAKAVGLKIVKVIAVPSSQTTFAATLQQLRATNPDAVLNLLTPGAQALLTQTAKSEGYSPIWVADYAGQDPKSLAAIVPNTSALWLESALPPATAKDKFNGIAQFDTEMTAAAGSGVSDAGSDGWSEAAVNTWLQIHAIAEVAKTVKGALTAATVMTALKSTHGLDLYGLTSWSPAQTTGPKVAPYVTDDGAIYYGPVVNGTFTPVSTTSADLFKIDGLS
jgi:ABC-type branched-subunit amino acid transport system substrate-binding protein